MTNQPFKIFLDGKLIGTTLLEKADVPMGVVFGQIELDGIDDAYTFFKTHCLAKQIGFTHNKEQQLLTTRHIPNLKVFNSDNTEIKGVAVSVSGQGQKDFEITIEGIPHNVFNFTFSHHVEQYANQFGQQIVKDDILEVGIDEKERLFIKPATVSFSLIYRTGTEVHWDAAQKMLYAPKTKEWTYLDWYKQIIGVVRSECDYKLELTSGTVWTNIPDDLKKAIIEVSNTSVVPAGGRSLQMSKKIIYCILGVTALLLLAYFLQPIKKGKGLDTATTYELVDNWPALPTGLVLGNPTGIGIDTNQNIVVFHRADRTWPLLGSMPDSPITANTILIIDKDNGKLLNSWGGHLFIMPHGLTVDGDNNIWVTDVGLHQVFKFSHDGKLLLQLGVAKVSGNDSVHFNQPTDVAVAADGSFYVSDGYGNSRVVKFSATGQYLLEWGKKGDKEGEFNIPHGISLGNNGIVFVADRENNRIQVFDSNGRFIQQLTNGSFGAFCAVAFDKTQSKLLAVDDFTFLKMKHRGSDVFIFDMAGEVQTRFGRSGAYQGSIAWYHDLTVDKDGNIYVGDILGNRVQQFRKVVGR